MGGHFWVDPPLGQNWAYPSQKIQTFLVQSLVNIQIGKVDMRDAQKSVGQFAPLPLVRARVKVDLKIDWCFNNFPQI